MSYFYSTRSFNRLMTAEMALRRIFFEAIKFMDLTILCGHRTEEKQNEAFREGRSKVQWPDSRHNSNPSTAVDVAPYPIDWNDTGRFYQMAALVLEIAIDQGTDLHWGGNWPIKKRSTLFDGPHFELVD